MVYLHLKIHLGLGKKCLLSVNCENNKSNSLQMSDIRFLQVSVFFFSLGPFCVRNVKIKLVGTNIYGYSQLRGFKIWEHFCYVLKHLYFFLKFGAVKFVVFKFVGT